MRIADQRGCSIIVILMPAFVENYVIAIMADGLFRRRHQVDKKTPVSETQL
jgi:hypothetical protein